MLHVICSILKTVSGALRPQGRTPPGSVGRGEWSEEEVTMTRALVSLVACRHTLAVQSPIPEPDGDGIGDDGEREEGFTHTLLSSQR